MNKVNMPTNEDRIMEMGKEYLNIYIIYRYDKPVGWRRHRKVEQGAQ